MYNKRGESYRNENNIISKGFWRKHNKPNLVSSSQQNIWSNKERNHKKMQNSLSIQNAAELAKLISHPLIYLIKYTLISTLKKLEWCWQWHFPVRYFEKTNRTKKLTRQWQHLILAQHYFKPVHIPNDFLQHPHILDNINFKNEWVGKYVRCGA